MFAQTSRLIQNSTLDWMIAEPGTEDLAVSVLVAAVLAYPFYNHLFSSRRGEIPKDFWYIVPQAQGRQAQHKQQQHNERRISYAFEEHVSADFGILPTCVELTKSQKLDFIVFWGSQSGRAEALARQFAKYLQDTFGLRSLAADLDDFDIEGLRVLEKHQRVAFLLSTYGDGDPPDNTNNLWAFLKTAGTDNSLSSLQYLIFGLGNSNYRQFNQVALTVDERLQQSGAFRLCDPGVGDDANGGTELGFLKWQTAVQSELQRHLGLKVQARQYQPTYLVKENQNVLTDMMHLGEPWIDASQSPSRGGAPDSSHHIAQIVNIHKLWETVDRMCIHVDLDLGQDRRIKYKTGDYLSIMAPNPSQEVDQLLRCLQITTDRRDLPMEIALVDSLGRQKIPIPSPTTLDALFRYYLEICGTVSLDLAGALQQFAPSQAARDRLKDFCHSHESFMTHVSELNLTLSGLLRKVDPAGRWDIPISLLIERLKPMQPRLYSIASSAVAQPRQVSITASINKAPYNDSYAPDAPRGFYGLATTYFTGLEQATNGSDGESSVGLSSYVIDGPRGLLSGNKVFCSVIQSSFKLPSKSSAPIIMVGAGTGVAPFRGFVHERAQRSEFEKDIGRVLLFMGFRHPNTDVIYRDEWAEWQQKLGPHVFTYRTAFSRDESSPKTYVQDIMFEAGQEVLELLDVSGCRFYICGSARMARDVVSTLVKLKMKYSGCKQDDAFAWVRELRQFQTLVEDVWG